MSTAIKPTSHLEIRPNRTIAVHHRGSGKEDTTIVLCHGSCANMGQWAAQADFFEEQGFGVVLYDWLGCGQSEKPRDWYAYAADELYADLKAVVTKYKGKKRTILVGHSAGCVLSLRLAAEAEAQEAAAAGSSSPSKKYGPVSTDDALPVPSHVICVGPVLGGLPFAVRAIFHLPLFMLERMQPSLSAGFAERAYHPKTREASTPAHKALLARGEATNGANEMHMCKAYYRQFPGLSAEQIPKITRTPVLLIVGESDLLAPADVHARKLRPLLPTCEREVVIVPEGAHQVMEEQPEAVSKAILDFFLQQRRRSSKGSL